MLTKKQKKVLDYIESYCQKNGYSPSHDEIRKHFKLSSVSTANHYMKILQEKGYIKREKNAARAVEVGQKEDAVAVPFKGYIAAGQPIEAVEEYETVSVPKNMVSLSGEHFALGVKGDSMMDEGIFDGDMVIIRKQNTVQNGETAVALINNNEVTLKKIFREKNRIRLQPANPRLKPFYVKNVIIQGKVISAFRNIETQDKKKEILRSGEKNKIFSGLKEKPYFNKENFVLYQGNCISLLNNMPEGSIDMIFADPPYNLSNGGFTVHAGRMVSVNKGNWDKSRGFQDDYDFHFKWLEACRRVLKSSGTLWVSGTYHSIYQCGHALQALGYHILNDISWFKPNAAPNLSCRFFTASHETLIWARKDKKAKHTFDYKLMKEGNWTEDKFKKPKTQMRSVWSINTPKPNEKKFGKHPTQKPLDLLRRIVLASTKASDIVLDPFTGSSTTGIAAALNGRKFIGIDKEKDYLDLSIKRFEAVG